MVLCPTAPVLLHHAARWHTSRESLGAGWKVLGVDSVINRPTGTRSIPIGMAPNLEVTKVHIHWPCGPSSSPLLAMATSLMAEAG